jgi:hypothetical protein
VLCGAVLTADRLGYRIPHYIQAPAGERMIIMEVRP